MAVSKGLSEMMLDKISEADLKGCFDIHCSKLGGFHGCRFFVRAEFAKALCCACSEQRRAGSYMYFWCGKEEFQELILH